MRCICFYYYQYSNVHLRFPGPILSFLTPSLSPSKALPSLQKASTSNPRPSFFNCMKRDVTTALFCPTTFHKKKTIVYYLNLKNMGLCLFMKDSLSNGFKSKCFTCILQCNPDRSLEWGQRSRSHWILAPWRWLWPRASSADMTAECASRHWTGRQFD